MESLFRALPLPTFFTTLPIPKVGDRRLIVVLFGGAAFFTFSLSMFLLSFPTGPSKHTAAAPAVATAPGAPLRPLEMHIANNGLVLLRSARVVAVNGTDLTVSTAWGSADFIWRVHTDASTYGTREFGTHFIDRNGKNLSIHEVEVGGLVTITGMLDTTAKNPAINATSVRIFQ